MRQYRRPALAVALLVAAGGAGAQQYPQKPIRMLAISAPGGGTDLLARTYSQGMADALGQTIVIDNKPGGGGIIATETLAKSQPDGYTLLMTNTSHSVLPSLHKKLPYDVLKDFAPVSLVALTHSLLLVHPSMPVKSVKELVDLAKEGVRFTRVTGEKDLATRRSVDFIRNVATLEGRPDLAQGIIDKAAVDPAKPHTVPQTIADVVSGRADAGVVYYSAAVEAKNDIDILRFPATVNISSEIRNAATVPATAKEPAVAIRFVRFLLSGEGRTILDATGQPPIVPPITTGELPSELELRH